MSPKIRCENITCSKTDFRSIAIGSFIIENTDHILNNENRFMYKGKYCAEGFGEGIFLCKKCKDKLKVCNECNYQKCICITN